MYIFAIANFENIYAILKCYANKDRKKKLTFANGNRKLFRGKLEQTSGRSAYLHSYVKARLHLAKATHLRQGCEVAPKSIRSILCCTVTPGRSISVNTLKCPFWSDWPVADLGGRSRCAPPTDQNFFKFMGVFRKCINIMGQRPPRGWRPLLRQVLDPSVWLHWFQLEQWLKV